MDNIISKENQNNKNFESLLLFILQIKEIKECIEKDYEKIMECYLINNDIINLYLKNAKISSCIKCIDDYKRKNNNLSYSGLCKEIHINKLVNLFRINNLYNDKIKKYLNPIFLLTENMTLNGINFPYNFFILKKDYFNRIFVNNLKDLNFIEYKVLICKEGIFVWNKKKDKVIIYYLYCLNPDIINNNKFNKVLIFKTENDFYKELNNINYSGRIKYFKDRNIQNKNGHYNLNYNGKIIGQYINISMYDNFESKDNNDNYHEKDIETINEFENKNIQKIRVINIFLSNLLTCFSKIKILKDELLKRMKLNSNYLNNKKYILIKQLIEFIIYINNGDNNKLQETLNIFHNELRKKHLYEQIKVNEINSKYLFFENIINS